MSAHPTSLPSDFPATFRDSTAAQLRPGETILAWTPLDLNACLVFVTGLVIVTNQRVLAFEPPGKTSDKAAAEKVAGQSGWRSWDVAEGQDFRTTEFSGLGTLELFGPTGRLALWRFTGALATSVNRLVIRFRTVVATHVTRENGAATESPSVCPKCGGILGPDGECKACLPAIQPPPVQSLFRLGRFAKPRANMILLGFLLMLAATGAGLVTPYIVMPFTDKVLIPLQDQGAAAWDAQLVAWYLGWMFGSAIVAWLLAWARNFVLAYASEQISADLRNATYAHLQKLSLEFFGGQRTGDLIARVSSDTDRICTFLASEALDFCADVLMIILTAVILASINPVLAVVSLAPLLPISWLVQQVRNRLRHGYARGMTAWGEMVNVLADTIPGIRVVKAFAQESREIQRFGVANEWVVTANNRANRLSSLLGPTVSFLTECGALVIWACGAWLVAKHLLKDGSGVTVGTLTGFVAYSGRFYLRLESMSRLIAHVQRTGASAHRIFEILDRVPSVAEPTQPKQPGRVRGEIEFRDVRFRYGKREVIHGVNLKIEPGEMIGLVGPSGAGKSTLVNLVCRFYDVAEGSILVDGNDIRSYPIEAYRANVGIVLQEPFLFFGSVAENIAYGRPNASRAEIIAAARAARAHEFILRLTDGYDSLVGERGQALSGGERQRISIARALLTDPRILILDEATSSLDSETEREIQAALDVLVQGRTTIAIAHRLSTLRKANRLVVVEAGNIVEIGTHEDLLSRGGTYTRLHEAQMALAQQIGIG